MWCGDYVARCLCGQVSMLSGDYVVRWLCGQVAVTSNDYSEMSAHLINYFVGRYNCIIR